jgi:hypothetical protein
LSRRRGIERFQIDPRLIPLITQDLTMTSKLAACLALLALPLAACEEPDGGPSYLRASLSGAVVEEYHGNAEWHVGTPAPGQQLFQIVSLGLATDSKNDQFALTRWDGGRLREGRHPVSLVDMGDGADYNFQPKGITIQYFRRWTGGWSSSWPTAASWWLRAPTPGKSRGRSPSPASATA